MPVDKRPAGNLRIAPGEVSILPFHLAVPDLSLDSEKEAGPIDVPSTSVSPRDPIAFARSKISEKRFRDGHEQITTMIADLRDRRRVISGRLWLGSVVLTVASGLVLLVALIRESGPAGDAAERGKQPKRATHPPSVDHLSATGEAPVRAWSNEVPEERPIQPVHYESVPGLDRSSAWLDGTIADGEGTPDGALHDDH